MSIINFDMYVYNEIDIGTLSTFSIHLTKLKALRSILRKFDCLIFPFYTY